MSVACVFVEGAGLDGGIGSSDITIGVDLLGSVGGGNSVGVGVDVMAGFMVTLEMVCCLVVNIEILGFLGYQWCCLR